MAIQIGRLADNIYSRNVPLRLILIDGWVMGLIPEQTIREASNAGYSRCVVETMIASVWGYMDAEFRRVELSRLHERFVQAESSPFYDELSARGNQLHVLRQ